MLRTAHRICLYGCNHVLHTRSFTALAETAAGASAFNTQQQAPHRRSCVCDLHTSAVKQTSERTPEPTRMRVISIPNPFRWLHNQVEIATLKREWDPNFSIEDFKYGVKQAVCTSSELISRREWGELRGLLSQKAITKLRSTQWTSDQVHNLVLNPKNIQVTQIDNVSLQTVVDRKYCDIDVTVIGTRAPYNPDKHSLVVLEYFARFHREYTDHVLPEWTITVFKLNNFEAYQRKVGT
ncbi:m-AAA protease-interacting protein 1, mitochondrial [Macrobrachium rosenbergii]|uniref:m-AAA protease-interacting protein 1, mitochondrial n=1 Tax=Macrobrachium rosenbergii TaxID=79674 RepID=UPI0034D771B3